MRAETSAARMVRACPVKVFWKDSVKPRTPVSAATPIATDTMTNRNFAGAAWNSRHAMRRAALQLRARGRTLLVSGVTVGLRDYHRSCGRCVFNDEAVMQDDATLRTFRDLRIVRHHHQGCAAFPMTSQQ